jgi:hypothetical protein
MNTAANYIDKFRFGFTVSLLIVVLMVATYFQYIKNAIVFVLMKFYEFFIQYNKT